MTWFGKKLFIHAGKIVELEIRDRKVGNARKGRPAVKVIRLRPEPVTAMSRTKASICGWC